MSRLNSGTIVIAGGSGFVGTSLACYLTRQGFQVTVLSRKSRRRDETWDYVKWDGRTCGEWTTTLNGAVGLVNLAGRTVDCIKSPDHQDEILRSRVESTWVLGEALRQIDRPPPVWVQMSTAHIYGDPPLAHCDETSPHGFGFAPFVAEAWEREFHESLLPQQRGVVLRTSFVLGRDRGAGRGPLARLRRLAKVGLGGTIGSGQQGISWIHELDLNRLFERALTNEAMQDTYIASSPHPVSQREFARQLRKSINVPIGLPAPEWMVRFGAHYLLRTDAELALYGRYVVSSRLRAEGFEFQFPRLSEALAELCQPIRKVQ